MFIPLVDVLRCTKPHEDTWLVASIERADDRDIITGMLGCPICFAEYAIRDGIVRFSDDVDRPAFRALSEDDVVRLAAALDLTDPRMTAVLHGHWGAGAAMLRGIAPVQLLLVNAADGIASGDGVSIVQGPHAPIARGAVNAAAIGEGASDAMVASLIASVKPGGRVLGLVSTPPPVELTELIRDDEVWVAEVPLSASVSAPIMPMRRPRQG